ncbi:uncharacterized protein LOC105646171 isoform X2 [Jatropha curcas]|uniref:uncharacterized protein LOC105646171 isoform X2 n=1 Tax=Jatropha curcas TaxID=180498 RepID=UPI0005FAA2C2|nr:uncharacterized protein LOC105646171 isoform X2 [Jatropha curcas]
MERNPKNMPMEQSDVNKKFQYHAREPGREGFQPASQAFTRDSTGSRNTNLRLPNPNVPEIKPVLNYSIQTGEEFALEFMRDRVNHKKPHIPNTLGDPHHVTGYMEPKGIVGTSHTGPDRMPDTSLLPVVETGPKKVERTSLSLYEERNNYGSVHSAPQTSSEYESRELVHGFTSSMASDSSSIKMKVLCSFGGTILPRPSDGKLRYVGGDTHIIRISRDISWQELEQKTLAIYNQPHVIKYQLPGEDLDALVSVSCDEDLRNMMEEWTEVEDREGSQRLRMFLLSMNDLEDAQFGPGSSEGDSVIMYVAAVNGMDFGSRKNSIGQGLASCSGNNLSEFDGLNVDREKGRPLTVSVGVSSSPLTSPFQSAQPILQNSSNAYEIHPQFYHDQMMGLRESQQFQPNYRHNSSNCTPSEEIPYSISIPGLMNQQGGLNEGQSRGSFQAQNSQSSVKDVKLKRDISVQHGIDLEKTRSVEKVYATSVDETVAVAAQGDFHSLPLKNDVKHQQAENVSPSVDAIHQVQVPKPCEDDQCSISSGLGCADSGSNLIDLSYLESSAPPQRVYYSERIPREQADLMNRLSKSEDSHGSQFLLSHSHSDITEQTSITESSEKLIQSDLASDAEHTIPAAKPLHIDSQPINDGLARLQKYEEFADAASQMNNSLSNSQDVLQSEFQLAVQNDVDDKDSANMDTVLKADCDYTAGDHEKLPIEEKGETRPGNSTAFQVTSQMLNKDSVPDLPGLKMNEITRRDFVSNNALGHSQPFSRTESSTNDVSQGISPVGISATKQADISIDINDRFPRDLLSEIFSKGILSEDKAGISPMHNDGAGMSVVMENHEPKHWSYFQKLAQEEFVQKDVSLIDQDHLGSSSLFAKVKDGGQKPYHFAPLTTDGVSMGHKYSQLNFGVDSNQKNLPRIVEAESAVLSDFGHSQGKDCESIFGAMIENLKSSESHHEGGKLDDRNFGMPPTDPSLVDFDIHALQVIRNDDLEELRELGSGTFGTVYHGKWRGSDVAIKRLKKICFTGRSSEQERLTIEFWREAEILSKLHHPNVVAFYGVVQDGPGGTLATVTEYMVDGSLRHVLLKKDRYLDRRKRLLIAMDAAFGMEYLHSKNIVHFDLKCDNLLVNLKDPQRPICKVGDFGLSKIKRNTLVTGGVRGTLPWMAPELLNGSSNKVSEKVDVFSFGIVLWEILTGEEPYANMHYGAIIGGIVNNTLRPAIPNFCDAEWKRLMEQCWAPNPAARPSFTEIAGRLRIMSTAAGPTKGHGHKTPK